MVQAKTYVERQERDVCFLRHGFEGDRIAVATKMVPRFAPAEKGERGSNAHSILVTLDGKDQLQPSILRPFLFLHPAKVAQALRPWEPTLQLLHDQIALVTGFQGRKPRPCGLATDWSKF